MFEIMVICIYMCIASGQGQTNPWVPVFHKHKSSVN